MQTTLEDNCSITIFLSEYCSIHILIRGLLSDFLIRWGNAKFQGHFSIANEVVNFINPTGKQIGLTLADKVLHVYIQTFSLTECIGIVGVRKYMGCPCMRARARACVCVCARACVCVCVCACESVCLSICLYNCLSVREQPYAVTIELIPVQRLLHKYNSQKTPCKCIQTAPPTPTPSPNTTTSTTSHPLGHLVLCTRSIPIDFQTNPLPITRISTLSIPLLL